jgi:hypothetical protein
VVRRESCTGPILGFVTCTVFGRLPQGMVPSNWLAYRNSCVNDFGQALGMLLFNLRSCGGADSQVALAHQVLKEG